MTDIEKAAKYDEPVEIAENYLALWKHQKGSGLPFASVEAGKADACQRLVRAIRSVDVN